MISYDELPSTPAVSFPRVVLAALRGGAGKTTLSMGLISAFRGRGREVVPFKKGPDFIDPRWLALAAAHPCYNIDPFLTSREACLRSLWRHGKGKTLLIEGNRGLFDGMDEKGTFSTAELAKLIRSPVVLIVDCTMATRTVAAMVLGCLRFDEDLRIEGVILNRIGGQRHGSLIVRTVEKYTGIPVVGVVRRMPERFLPERHMGLTPPQEHPGRERAIQGAGRMVAESVDVDRILAMADAAPELPPVADEVRKKSVERLARPRVGVVQDSAFWFYYPENLEALERSGAELGFLSALAEEFPRIDALYIGGGFPETHAERIAENRSFRRWLQARAEEGLPIYAECGGLMVLGKELVTSKGRFPMAGVFPLRFVMKRRPQAHGYTRLRAEIDTPFFSAGTCIRGHEFHYSEVQPVEEPLPTAFVVERGAGSLGRRDGFVVRNVLGMYSHVHAEGVPEWSERLVGRAMEYALYRARDGRGSGVGAKAMQAGNG